MQILDFEGTLCGNYAVISDFQIKSSAANCDHGLFGRQGGTVRCLYLKEFTIKGKRNIGAFAGGNVQVVVDVYQYGRDFGVNIGGAYAVRYSGATVENTYVLEGQKLSGIYINDAGTIVTVDPAPTLTLSEIEEMLGKSFPIQ